MTPSVVTLTQFNALPRRAAELALNEVCRSPQFASLLADARPFASGEALYETADAVLASLGESEIDSALAGHPRIGGRGGRQSRREQAGVADSAPATLEQLAMENRRYEQKFGYTYLVCATGRTGEELLAFLRERLDNPPEVERAVMRCELARINRIRLARLLGDDPS